ncbi:hypothetical protein GALMADRAFT_143256 [Galerina marginata CBS 339.88]|uniref:Uncharacterized protein n=1 Tax=Galerina marginata (strain CBS 339.88) TaxID=685588 RepID=A0A067SXN7_GALM3|nr:hypothetical protein GALMADRAFT_143256 [Galerina marginata CBS 339.88]
MPFALPTLNASSTPFLTPYYTPRFTLPSASVSASTASTSSTSFASSYTSSSWSSSSNSSSSSSFYETGILSSPGTPSPAHQHQHHHHHTASRWRQEDFVLSSGSLSGLEVSSLGTGLGRRDEGGSGSRREDEEMPIPSPTECGVGCGRGGRTGVSLDFYLRAGPGAASNSNAVSGSSSGFAPVGSIVPWSRSSFSRFACPTCG